MIIDAHCHVVHYDWLPEKWWLELAKVAVPILAKMGMTGLTPQAVIDQVFPGFIFDPEGEKQLAAMDEAGIDMAVILPLDYGLCLGEAPLSVEEINKTFADLQNSHPDRFISFVTVDPRRPDAADIVKKGLDEWGLRGLKLHPGSGFHPNSKEAYEVIKVAADRGLPVVSHTGAIVAPLYSRGCDPMRLDDVCVDFPEATVVAAHLGHGYRRQLAHLGACKTNLWTDCSDNQRRALHEPELFCRALREALDNFTPERVMFGTDAPYLRMVMPDKDFVQFIRDLPDNAPGGVHFTREEMDGVLGGNAARLYQLA